MSLVEYAESELRLAGLLDVDDDYNGWVGASVLEMVRTFASQGHSGMSAELTTQIVGKLLRYEPLTDLTYEADQWTEHPGPIWQHKRDSKVFSTDGGATHYRLGEDGH